MTSPALLSLSLVAAQLSEHLLLISLASVSLLLLRFTLIPCFTSYLGISIRMPVMILRKYFAMDRFDVK